MTSPRTPWKGLSDELNAWQDAGLQATFWWRDDDVIAPTQALDTMLDLSNDYHAPLALAVIPECVLPDLADTLNPHPNVSILQHGFSHINYAHTGEKKAELGLHRDLNTVFNELSVGRKTLDIFDRVEPVLVPPWNRIDERVTKGLANVGFRGVSTFTSRKTTYAAPYLTLVNTHIDIIDWKGSRGFLGENSVLAQATNHLKARRLGACDANEPTGLLTHHLVHDDACWTFVETFLEHINTHQAARVISAAEAFAA